MCCMLSVVISGGKVFAHLLGEFHRGVVAHALLAVIHGGDLKDHGKVPSGGDRDCDGRDLHVENLGVLRLHAEAVIGFAVAPRDHVDDEVDVGAFLDRAHAEQLRDVDDADAAQLDIMLEYRRRGADQLMRRDLFDLNGVVGDQAVAALDELDGRLALADAAVAVDEDALAVDLDQHAVAGHAGGQGALEVGDQARDDIGRRVLRAEHGHVVFFRHLQAFRHRLEAAGEDQRRALVGQEMVKNDDPLLRRELLQVGRLHRAADVDAHRLIVVKKTGQMQARAADIVNSHADLVKVRGLVEKVKIEFRNQLGEQDGIGICHAITSYDSILIIPALPAFRNREIPLSDFLNFSNFSEKSACNFQPYLLIYLSALCSASN